MAFGTTGRARVVLSDFGSAAEFLTDAKTGAASRFEKERGGRAASNMPVEVLLRPFSGRRRQRADSGDYFAEAGRGRRRGRDADILRWSRCKTIENGFRLAEFGRARRCGSPFYSSPEAWNLDYDYRADVWRPGC